MLLYAHKQINSWVRRFITFLQESLNVSIVCKMILHEGAPVILFFGRKRKMRSYTILLLLFAPLLTVQVSAEERTINDLDVARIRQLHHISEVLGDKIWPGFDTSKIPVAVNNNDKQEMLISHPNPPKEFHPFKKYKLGGKPVMIREGCTRYGPKGGGWAVEIDGESTGYVSVLQEGRDTEGYLSLILHECFHCFQNSFHKRAKGGYGETPETDVVYSTLIGLESQILKAVMDEPDEETARNLAKMFVAVRHERRKEMPQNLIIVENESEFSEGTASYSQARMYQLLTERGGLKPAKGVNDSQYNNFSNAAKLYQRELKAILPPKNQPITFFHSMYKNGMAQCLILDRLRPKWKTEMNETGMTQFFLLEKEFPQSSEEEATLLADAKMWFQYKEIFEEQKKLIDKRLDKIRSFLLAEGRRYRIYHHKIRGRFNWKPDGPVYHVPPSIEKEVVAKLGAKSGKRTIEHRRLVWAGGIRRFDKTGMVFKSIDTPMIYGFDFIEWIDLNPAKDDTDMNIESEKFEKGIHYKLKIKTAGFTLTLDKARIDWTPEVVEIIPVM